MVVLDTYFGLVGPPQQHVTQVIGWETWKEETHKEFTDQGLSAHLWFQSEDQMVFLATTDITTEAETATCVRLYPTENT